MAAGSWYYCAVVGRGPRRRNPAEIVVDDFSEATHEDISFVSSVRDAYQSREGQMSKVENGVVTGRRYDAISFRSARYPERRHIQMAGILT
jgi:hypothetical protein